MTTRAWIRKLFGRTPRTVRKTPARFRPHIEALEGRVTPSTFTVTNANDSGSGSLRQAVLDANAAPGADSIAFADFLSGQTIETVNLAITDDVDIHGPQEGPVILSGPSPLFHQFMGGGRILDIAAGANVSISRLTLKNGDATNPDPFNPTGEAFGGAIRNAGTLTVRQSLFYHNGAGEPNGGIGGGGGGAIYNSGSLTVIASSFAANFADWGSGGAIYNAGTATVTNSTFIDNYTGLFGGAIYNAVGRTLTVNNSTILKSGGDPQAPVLGLPLGQHGIANLGTMALNNTIVANTPVGSDVVNIGIVTGSHNLIKDGSGGVPGTITGDPMLAPPVYSSLTLLPKPGEARPPFTLSPLAGSPAIDAGNNSAVSSFVDQRGAPRINNGVVDIGAVEAGIAPVTLVVTTLTDEDNNSIDPALGAGTSLREALSVMLPEDVTVTFAPGLAGTIALDASMGALRINDFDFSAVGVRGDVTLVGPGADVITIDGLNQTRILKLDAYIDVAISGLTFARGAFNGLFDGGGAIQIVGARLTVSDSAFIDNTALLFGGGAIHNKSGNVTVHNSTFVGNSADQGGAIATESWMTVTDSTFMKNSARRGGAIWAQFWNDEHGSFIRPTVTSSTFSENSAGEYGGAIFIASYHGASDPAELSVINSTISNNSAGLNGGGIHVAGDLTLYGSTVYGNSAASAGPTVAGGIAIADLISGGESYVEMVTLVNNIVAGSTSGADLTVSVIPGGIVTGSHNLISDGRGGLPNTITGTPLLGPLADYGGPTKTHALLPGSPAINAGASGDGIPATDQRGKSRVGGGDIGAFESQGFTLTPVAGSTPQSARVGTAFANPLAVSVTANNPVEPVNGGVVHFTAPASGASANLSASSAIIAGGQAAVTATANATNGSYNATASAAGATAIDFHLTNTAANAPPTLAVPAAQTGYEDVYLAIRGITVGDPEGGNLTVTLAVSRGKLTLGTTTGLTVSGNGTGAVTLSGSIANLNAALATLLYRGNLNYGGADTLNISVSDGSLSTSGNVGINVKSAAQQAADLQTQVSALETAEVLSAWQARLLNLWLDLQGNRLDVKRVEGFLNMVKLYRRLGFLTAAQADTLLESGNILLLSVSRR